MASAESFEFRTLALPQGLFVVLWEEVAAGRMLLALLPRGEAQSYLDALHQGQVPEISPQLVEQLGPSLIPLAAEDEAILTRCLSLDSLSRLPSPA